MSSQRGPLWDEVFTSMAARPPEGSPTTKLNCRQGAAIGPLASRPKGSLGSILEFELCIRHTEIDFRHIGIDFRN